MKTTPNKRYRVRFHLAKGDNFMQWQVFDKTFTTPKNTTILRRAASSCVTASWATNLLLQEKFSTETIKQFALGLHVRTSLS